MKQVDDLRRQIYQQLELQDAIDREKLDKIIKEELNKKT